MHGEFDRAFEAAGYGIELGRQIEHLPTQAACVFFSGVVRGWHGDLAVAAPAIDEALALCDKAGDVFRRYLAHGWRGQAYLMAGRRAPAAADLDRCLDLGGQIGTTFHRGAFQAFRARLHLLSGEVGEALRDSAEALEVASQTGQAWSRSIALRIHAETLLALEPPRLQQADEEIRTAIAIQERRECLFDLAYARIALGHVRAVGGDREGAREAYVLGGRMFEAMGVAPGRQLVAAALAALDAGESALGVLVAPEPPSSR
jgi:tetratricopeptide (TPR) repeat protein